MDDAWDIATDLPFLIAKDDELSDELAQVSAILTSIDEEANESSKSVSSHPKSVKRTSNSLSASITAPAWISNKYEFRQRQELRLLQKQVTELKEQLELARISSVKKLDLPKIELTPLENSKHCRLILLMQVMADTNESAPPQLKIDTTVDSIMTTVEQVSCSSIPHLELPTSEPLEEIDRLEVKDGLPPSLLAWLERGRRKEILIRRAVNRAILDFNDTSQREITDT
ncbi:hypothetical protein Ae201684P_017192 [Aphanomyces euteiches]|nr:hypothetical protein Ae201684P_017192 [Aphanomyces euteiches]